MHILQKRNIFYVAIINMNINIPHSNSVLLAYNNYYIRKPNITQNIRRLFDSTRPQKSIR